MSDDLKKEDAINNLFSLEGKIAMITGAASGIGRCIAEVYAKAGAKVWIADINKEKSLETETHIKQNGGIAKYVECDVARIGSPLIAVETILKEDDRIDILVNNAGIGFVGNILDTPDEDFDRIMDVNVKGVYHCTKYVLPTMLKQKSGVIINMASIASLIAVKDRFAYCSSKGAVLAMTKSVAMDYVDQGIRCNCICPARIHTPFVDEYLEKNYPDTKDEMFAKLSAYQPIGRMGKPEEVAHLALYLASDEAAFHTGDVFPISGGALMG